MKPELAWSRPRQRYGNRDRVVAGDRLLHEANYLAVVDLDKTQVVGLQHRGVVPAYPIEPFDIAFDIPGPIPVPHFQLVFLGVEAFLLSRERLVVPGIVGSLVSTHVCATCCSPL